MIYKKFDVLELSKGGIILLTYFPKLRTLGKTRLVKVADHRSIKYTDVSKFFPLQMKKTQPKLFKQKIKYLI